MADEDTGFEYEHSRTRLPDFAPRTLEWQGWRVGRPLAGLLTGFAVVVIFLALRGEGWSRPHDVHLLIVVNAAIAAALAVNFIGEWVHHWLAITLAASTAGVFLAIRELGEVGATAGDALLALAIAAGVAAAAVVAYDVRRIGRRQGY